MIQIMPLLANNVFASLWARSLASTDRILGLGGSLKLTGGASSGRLSVVISTGWEARTCS